MGGSLIKSAKRKIVDRTVLRTVEGRKPNDAYRTREHLTESEVAKLLNPPVKANRHGLRDWLIGLLIYRHGLRVSEAGDLRWDDLDLPKRTVAVRRLKGSVDSVHYLERDELAGQKRLHREQDPKSAYVFTSERGQPFGRMGVARMIERAGQVAEMPFPVHVHMLRHSTGYALANKGMDTPAAPTCNPRPRFHPPTPSSTPPCRRSRSKISGAQSSNRFTERLPEPPPGACISRGASSYR